jgi:L-methionine (R)-S-oxide reductase
MFTIQPLPPGASKAESYRQIYSELAELVKGESNFLANAANVASLLYHVLPDVNWVGFYWAQNEELVLGPFQGKPACARIPFGQGVSGTAAKRAQSIIVPDVNEFEGHLACDTASRSEIAVPLLNWGKLVGVLDVDSAIPNRFDDDDSEGLEGLAAVFLSSQHGDDMPDFEALADQPNA